MDIASWGLCVWMCCNEMLSLASQLARKLACGMWRVWYLKSDSVTRVLNSRQRKLIKLTPPERRLSRKPSRTDSPPLRILSHFLKNKVCRCSLFVSPLQTDDFNQILIKHDRLNDFIRNKIKQALLFGVHQTVDASVRTELHIINGIDKMCNKTNSVADSKCIAITETRTRTTCPVKRRVLQAQLTCTYCSTGSPHMT